MSEMAAMNPEAHDKRSMEDRLKSAYADANESLGLLRETLKAGGVLREDMVSDVNVAAMTPYRTPLEAAVTEVEKLGWMIRELNNQVIV